MFTKIVNIFLDAELLLFNFCVAEAVCFELYMAVQILSIFEQSVAVFAFNCGAVQFNSLIFTNHNQIKYDYSSSGTQKSIIFPTHAVMYPIIPCTSIVLETMTVLLYSGFLEIYPKGIPSEGK